MKRAKVTNHPRAVGRTNHDRHFGSAGARPSLARRLPQFPIVFAHAAHDGLGPLRRLSSFYCL